MDNRTIQELLQIPAINRLLEHFEQEINKIDRVSDITGAKEEVAIEVAARNVAVARLKEMIKPLVEGRKSRPQPKPFSADYVAQ